MKAHELRESLKEWLRPPLDDPNWSHPTYVNEIDKIANTIDPDFCYSKGQGFKGIGLVGILGEIAMYTNQGDILEIGIGTSSLYLTTLAKRYDRIIYHNDMDTTKFLYGIGTKQHISPNSNVFLGTSDEFFKNTKLTPLAFAFIDGCHEYEQAKRDFWNTVPYVVENGYILLHDTYPPFGEGWILDNMCWDCYRLRQDLEKDTQFDCLSFPLHGQIGFTLIRKKPLNRTYYQE
jgi:hypothetical protein